MEDSMNTWKIGKLTVAAVATIAGSVILSGCATNAPQEPAHVETTVDLLESGPDTYPQYSTHDMVFDNPAQAGWTVESRE